MTKRLTPEDWIGFALTTLARDGYDALKADVLARKLRVSRGSFYWHFADIAAYHAAILARWHEVAAEQIIANVEAASKDENPLALLLRPCHDRPRRRPADQRDELAAFHSITSSARAFPTLHSVH